MEYRRTSFLLEKAPEQYKVLSGLKPFALIYAGVLAIAILLSLFVQWGIVEFFINLLMGVYRNSIFAIHSLFLSFGVRIFFRQLIFGDLSRICDSQGVKIRI